MTSIKFFFIIIATFILCSGIIRFLQADPVFTFTEKFENTTYYDSARSTLDWNTSQHSLRLPATTTGNTKQVNGVITLASDDNLYFSWLDFREGIGAAKGHIYLQKFDKNGIKQFASDKRVDSGSDIADGYYGTYPKILSSGSYVYIYWTLNNKMYLQKMDFSGNKQWASDFQVNPDTVSVSGPDYGFLPAVVNSNSELVFFWKSGNGLYMQKVNTTGSGSRVGDTVQLLSDNINTPAVDRDATDNYYVGYSSYDYANRNYVLCLDKFDSSGTRLWSQHSQISSASRFINSIDIVIDLGGNCYFMWDNYDSSTEKDIYLQKVNSSGVVQWTNPVKANTDTGYNRQQNGRIRLGNDGNLYLLWEDQRTSNKTDIYVRSFDSNGAALMAAEQKINSGNNDTSYASYRAGFYSNFVLDTTQKFYVSWFAYRNQDYDIYLQKVSSSGVVEWSSDTEITQEEQGGGYVLSGTAQSTAFDLPPENITAATVYYNATTYGETLKFYISHDGGANWTQLVSGSSVTFPTAGSDLRWKTEFATANPFESPVIYNILIEYSIAGIADPYHKIHYIYDDTWHYLPTGWMNNTNALTMTTAYAYEAIQGAFCTKLTYDPNLADWVGFFAQSKGKWRSQISETPKGINLSGYSALVIKAKAGTENADAIEVQFGVGENGDTCRVTTVWMTLGSEWNTYVIDLTNKDLSDINGVVMVNMRQVRNVDPSIYIDDIKYIGPGPSSVTDLRSSLGPAAGKVTLAWTSPSGDYTNTQYILKHSVDYIANQDDFDNATTYTQLWAPAAPGTVEQYTLEGLTPGQSYYFAIETIDSQGNQSGLSNICYAFARSAGVGILINSTIDLGEVQSAGTKMSDNFIEVTNIGGVPTTLTLNVNNPPGWTIDTSNEQENHFVLLAAFASAADQIYWNINNHALSSTAIKCTATRYAGDQSGMAIPVDETRNLWVRFTAPIIIAVGTNKQTIFINIIAGPAD